MRGIGLYFRRACRNDPIELVNPRPIESFGQQSIESGNAGLDGFTVLSRADPQAQGNPPPVKGVVGPVYRGPDQSFES